MSVKAKLRALIAAPFVSERSAPDGSNVIDISGVITGGTPGTEIPYTPPADGYVSFAINNNSGANAYARINAESLEMAQTVAAGAGYSTSLRVRKGNTLNMYFSSIPHVYWAKFIRTVGGGGETPTLAGVFACGGGLWLRTTSALCSRLSGVHTRAFLSRFPLSATQRLLQGISTRTKTLLSLRLMGSYPCRLNRPQSLFASVTAANSTGRAVNLPVRLLGLLRSCLAGKARHTITTRKARTLQPFAICASTPTWANSALLTGGF
nr:MAG TPA: hypothetical protein [Caudoviricetes sp.]